MKEMFFELSRMESKLLCKMKENQLLNKKNRKQAGCTNERAEIEKKREIDEIEGDR